MPQLGETVTEGTITRWMKAVGDTVARDEPLFEVSTDKVDSEVPSPASGTLREILVPEGETVQVGARLAVIGDAGAPADGSGGGPAPATATASPAAPAHAAPEPPEAATPQQAPAHSAPPPVPDSPAASSGTPAASDGSTGVSSDLGGAPPPPAIQLSPWDVTASSPPPPSPSPPLPSPPPPSTPTSPPPSAPPPPPEGFTTAAAAEPSEPRLLSPVVRRLLSDNAIDPGEVTGTGPGGRITREDVLDLIDVQRRGGVEAPAAPAPSAAPPPPPPSPPPPAAVASIESVEVTPPPPPTEETRAHPVAPEPPAQHAATVPIATSPTAPARSGGEMVVPFSNVRRRTAEHMVRSKATSPHAFIAMEVDFESVERVRREWGERFKAEEEFSLTYLPFVARATVEAIRDFPYLNASVGDNSLVVHQQVNLGIAVDLDHDGLIVPVIHRAEEVTLRGIARRIRDLAERARSRQLTADDISGGTFSITNDGPFGTYFTVPIINQPQVGILATDGIKRRPVVVPLPDGAESIAIHSTGLLGMSWDHRAVDGAYVSSFLHKVSDVLVTRDWASEL
jgi:pyruvate dehydrogenase E2 component (dihydrolipoamide acetyltransferase)